jgi:hypothetical protein
MKIVAKKIMFATMALLAVALSGCMEWSYGLEEKFNATGEGLFICNEGNFQYGNATLSYYNPKAKKVENELYKNATFLDKKRMKERDAERQKEYAKRLELEEAIARELGKQDKAQAELAEKIAEERKKALNALKDEEKELEKLKKIEYEHSKIKYNRRWRNRQGRC